MRLASALLLVSIAIVGPSPAGQSGPNEPVRPSKRNVLILNSYHAGYNWTDELGRGLQSVLTELNFEVEIWEEFLDVKRRSAAEDLIVEFDYLRKKYKDTHFDLVITTDDDATALVAERGGELFGHAPVVFCGVSGQELLNRLPHGTFSGLVEVYEPEDLLNEALRMFPRAARVVVATDNSMSNEALYDQWVVLKGQRADLRFSFLNGRQSTFAEILEALRQLPADAVVFASSFTHDKDGSYLPAFEAGRAMAQASRAPIFSQNTSLLGQGFLAGNANSGFEHGQLAGRLAVRVLRGEATASVGFQRHRATKLLLDYGAMQRFHVNRSAIPKGATVLNRPPSWLDSYEQNKKLWWGAIAFMLLQFGIIAALFANTARRRRAESAMRATQRQFERAQELAHLGSWERDTATQALMWSDEIFRIFGVTRATMTPTMESLLARIHPEDRERVREITRAADAGKQNRWLEYRIVRPNGEVRFLRVQGEWQALPDGRSKVAGTVQDMTELKELEAQVQHSLRVESLGTLAGGIAHDFNNLLTVINGYSEVLLRKVPESDPSRRPLEQIQHAGERAAELTGKLLAFGRKQMMQPALVQMNDVIHSMTGLLRPLVGDAVELRLALEPGLHLVRVDPGQLERAVLNLAANARDAMPSGGVLTLTTSAETITEYVSWEGFQVNPGSYVALTVKDNGIGMDETTRKRIFEPFFTTKMIGKGTGLGLSTVYGIVQQSGGVIDVESTPGGGSQFRLLFPAETGPRPESGAREEAVAASGGAGKILLVEDDALVRGIAQDTLVELGYEVWSAESGQEALSAVAGKVHEVDLLLTDVRMPAMSGTELAAQLREKTPGLRVLFISGYAEGWLSGAEAEPLSDFLRKPFLPQELADAVHRLMTR